MNDRKAQVPAHSLARQTCARWGVDKVHTMNLSIMGSPFNTNTVTNFSSNIVNVVPDIDVRVVGYRYF